MASENVKLLGTTKDIIEYKGSMEFVFSPDDGQVSKLLVRSFYHHTQHVHPETRIVSHSNRRRHTRIPSKHVMTKNVDIIRNHIYSHAPIGLLISTVVYRFQDFTPLLSGM